MKKILRIAAAISGKAPQDIRAETTLAELGLSSSIKLYRLQYAIEDALGLELRPLAPGFTIDFIASMGGFSQTKYADDNNFDMAAETPEDISPAIESGGLFVGIDIEEMAGFPKTNNYREHAFYRKVFLNEEISYALLNQTPLQHLCGMFCAKEAMKKSAPPFLSLKMSEIKIDHEDHRPLIATTHRDLNEAYSCQVSISHSAHYAVATVLAIKNSNL